MNQITNILFRNMFFQSLSRNTKNEKSPGSYMFMFPRFYGIPWHWNAAQNVSWNSHCSLMKLIDWNKFHEILSIFMQFWAINSQYATQFSLQIYIYILVHNAKNYSGTSWALKLRNWNDMRCLRTSGNKFTLQFSVKWQQNLQQSMLLINNTARIISKRWFGKYILARMG